MKTSPLIQIHHVLEAMCGDCRLSVAPVTSGWELSVREQKSGRTLFSGERCSENAAKRAAADYLAMCGGRTEPLQWTLHW